MDPSPKHKPSFFQAFSRSQVASASATAVDFGLLFLLTEAFHVWYVVATALGALAGAITNFLMNRHWTFSARHGIWHRQAIRYALVSGASLSLNTAGVYYITETFKVHYSFSVIGVSLVVGFFFNFPLQRHFVFR